MIDYMQNRIIHDNQVDRDKWDELINNSDYSSPFQTQSFYTFCNTTKDMGSKVFAVQRPDNTYSSVCVICLYRGSGIKSFFTRRAIIYGGPVLHKECTESELKLLNDSIISTLRFKAIYLEVRNFHNYSKFSSVYQKSGWDYLRYLNIRVDLNYKNLDELIAGLKYNRRREIKQTFNAGLTYKEAETKEDLKKLYEILQNLYIQRVGLPIPSLEYFIGFWESSIMKVFVVKDNNKIVGGSFCPVLENTSIYTFYYCGVRDCKSKVYPTHLAVLAAMNFGIQNNLKYLDFMGAGLQGTDYGVRKYKLAFGGELLEEGRQLKIINKPLYNLGSFIIRKMKKNKA